MDYRLIANELAADVKSRDAIIADLEKQLVDEKRQHAQTKLQVQAVKHDLMDEIGSLKSKIYNLRYPSVPYHTKKRGYRCDCGTEIEYPFEQNFCSWCGAEFDWDYMGNSEDDSAYDRLKEERAGIC